MSAPLTRLRAALPSAVAGRVTVDAADLAAVVNAGITRQRRTHRARYAAGLCARVCCGRAREPERTLCRPCLDAASARKRPVTGGGCPMSPRTKAGRRARFRAFCARWSPTVRAWSVTEADEQRFAAAVFSHVVFGAHAP